jgi:predicted nucleotidyltransferase
VLSLSVFGSVGRNDSGLYSDIDIAVRLHENFSKGGFDYFGRMEELEQQLSAVLGCKADIIDEPVCKERLRAQIEKDRAVVF